MKKSLGSKRKEISQKESEQLFNIYKEFKEDEFSKIFPNSFFGYTKVTIENPLKDNGQIVIDKKGKKKPDPSKKDYERIPLSEDISEYFKREVKPNLDNSWMDRSKDKIGYQINFTKYFYKFVELRSAKSIKEELIRLDEDIRNISLNL